MPDYRRAFVPGGTFFFTLVTFDRAPILTEPAARSILRGAIETCRQRWPFDIDAFALLPDHLHAILTLPPGDADFSRRWALIKKEFTKQWLDAGGAARPVSAAKHRDRRAGVWQQRFWEHVVRDADDLHAHLDYVHYNPVRHGLAACPHAWPYSSFDRCRRAGFYEDDWLCTCAGRAATPPDFAHLPLRDME